MEILTSKQGTEVKIKVSIATWATFFILKHWGRGVLMEEGCSNAKTDSQDTRKMRAVSYAWASSSLA